jgi:hypothetical protein
MGHDYERRGQSLAVIGTSGGRRSTRVHRAAETKQSVGFFHHAAKPPNLTIGNRERGHEDDRVCLQFLHTGYEITNARRGEFHQRAERGTRPLEPRGQHVPQRQFGGMEIPGARAEV